MNSTVRTSATSTSRPVRAHAGDSDPDADEALRRARNPRSNWGVCPVCHRATNGGQHQCGKVALRLETDLAYLLRDRQTADAARREIAEWSGVAA